MESSSKGHLLGIDGHQWKPCLSSSFLVSEIYPEAARGFQGLVVESGPTAYPLSPEDLLCRYWMMLRFWALEIALSTQKVGSFQKQQLCSWRQVVAITKDLSSFPERSPSSPWDSLQILSNIWKKKKTEKGSGRRREEGRKLRKLWSGSLLQEVSLFLVFPEHQWACISTKDGFCGHPLPQASTVNHAT